MSINSEIQRIKTNIASIYTSADNMGAFLPQTQNADNLSSTIASISGGNYYVPVPFSINSGTVNINISNYVFDPRIKEMSIEKLFSYIFLDNSTITSADFSKLEKISAAQIFYYCFARTPLISINFNSLEEVIGNSIFSTAFSSTSLTSVTFPKLKIINGGYIFNSAFWGCTSLTTISFPSLTPNSFGEYTNQFNNMLGSVTGCTVHFPSNLQSVIGSWSDVTKGFGGTNTIILFDLPATS